MYQYLLALAVGGTMEDPEIKHTEPYRIVCAESEDEAVKVFNKHFNNSYFYGSILAVKRSFDWTIINKRTSEYDFMKSLENAKQYEILQSTENCFQS